MEKERKKLSPKAKKAIIAIAVIAGVLAIVIASCNIWAAVEGGKEQTGVSVGYAWSAQDDYSTQKTSALDMGGGDYKILVLTDIHLKNHGTFAAWLGINYLLDGVGKIALDNLVEDVNPDLILVLGDTVLTDRNDMEYERFVKQMDSYEKPWACVFGNHDDEGRADKAKLADVLKTSRYGLFEYGPEDLHGAGNYVIELQRNGVAEYALFMMDSGSSLEFSEGTEGINEKQVEWYCWNMDAFEQKYGKKPANMSFFHIPTPAYTTLDTFEQGERREDSYPHNSTDAIVDAMLENGGTHIFVGHDHSNNFIAGYKGMKLCYATKSSYNCYYSSGMTGGVVLTVDKDNNVKEEIVYF